MKYDHNIERSAELLRQAVPLMSRQAAALHPMSYAVWYGYVAEPGSPLHAAVDQQLRRDGRLDEAATEALFRRHVAEVDPATAQRVADGFQQLLSQMSESAALTGDETARYGRTLSRLSEELEGEAAGAALPGLGEARAHTEQMQAALLRMQQRLADSQRQIELLREEVRRARHESLLDSLTGLANRRAFDQRLALCLAAAAVGTAGSVPCLVMADIDHFKRINDQYGHGFGDQVLRAVAQVLRAAVPESGLAARVGGEEFALLLPAVPLDGARALAERVRGTIAASRIRRKGETDDAAAAERVTISLGVVPYRAGESPAHFIDRADQALYAAKNGGRDRVTVMTA